MSVTSLGECFALCFLSSDSEVCQLSVLTHGTSRQCSCSSVPARYLLLFPQRYLQDNNDNSVNIFYRSDRLWSNWSAVAVNGSMPLLFYDLDDVSGTMNLGSLGNEDRYAAQWMNGGGHFDCPLIGAAFSSKWVNLMR